MDKQINPAEMKASKELKIGIFVIVVLAVSFVIINFLREKDLFNRQMEISSVYQDVQGLTLSAPVYIKGYKAGSVTDIAYDGVSGHFTVTCSVAKGFMLPDALIGAAEGDFGLVWDGDSVDSCCGNWGEYLMINTPHKVSLYIRCGLPIIIWRKAAMARFVEENGIGICVGSLRDIAGIYTRLTQAEYERMCENVQRVSRMMSEGRFFSLPSER